MQKKINKELATALQKEVLLFDGAMGTELIAKGMSVDQGLEGYNLSVPELVASIHRDYVMAGADIITTNTFQANALHYTPEILALIIDESVRLARLAQPRFLAYSMGPVSYNLQIPDFTHAYELFKEQAILAQQAGVDMILVETMGQVWEAEAAIQAVKENTTLPIFCTFTFQQNGLTVDEFQVTEIVAILEKYEVMALGVNCSFGPDFLYPIVMDMLRVAKVPVIVQANAGLPIIQNNRTIYPMQAKEYAEKVQSMVQKGVRIVGGCCGTNPSYIHCLYKQQKMYGFSTFEVKK